MFLSCYTQFVLAAETETNIISGSRQQNFLVKQIVLCNKDALGDRFRLRYRIVNEVEDDKQFLYYNFPIAGNSTLVLPLLIGISPGDVLSIYAGLANLSVSAFVE